MQWHRLFFFQPTTVVELRKAPAAMSASGNAGATQRTMRDERVSVQKAARQVRKLPEKNSMSKTPSGRSAASAGNTACTPLTTAATNAVVIAGAH